MQEKDKKTLRILVPLAAVLLVFVIVLGFFVEEEPEIIVYPASNLSDSIFESQNMHYVENEDFEKKHVFSDLPYSIDTVNADGAVIGTGTAYAANDTYCFFYTEIPKKEKLSDIMREQFSKVLVYGCEEEDVTIEIMASDLGFKNGFSAEYQVEKITVDSENGVKEAHAVAYRLIVEDNDDYKEEHDIGVVVITMQLSNAHLNNAKALLDYNVQTIQYDKKLVEELIEKREKEEEEASKNAFTKDSSGTKNNGVPNSGTSKKPTSEAVGQEAKGFILNKDYEKVTVHVKWTNTEMVPELSLSDVDETFFVEPTVSSGGNAEWELMDVPAGVYLIHIESSGNYGTFTVEVKEN